MYMVDQMVQHNGMRTFEVLTGSRRRRSIDEQKAQIVAESFVPGAVVAEVARRHGISPQHLTAWRAAAKRGHLVLPARNDLEFARVVVSEAPDLRPTASLEVRIVTTSVVAALSARRIFTVLEK
jgi:transposase